MRPAMCGMVGPAEAVCRLDRGHEKDPEAAMCWGDKRDNGGPVEWRPPIFGPPPKPRQGPRKRIARPCNLTLSPEARATLQALAARPGGDSMAAEASAAILARAVLLGIV